LRVAMAARIESLLPVAAIARPIHMTGSQS
jgi:hypothetical protein